MYCPPINRERFEREVEERYRLRGNVQGQPVTCDHDSSARRLHAIDLDKRNLLCKIILYPIEIYKIVRDFYMIGNLTMNLQILHLLVLIHLFVKSFIHTVLIRGDKDKVEFLESIYYANIAGISSKPMMFDYLFFGCSVCFLCLKISRFYNAIDLSLKNINEYKDLRATQINLAYGSRFYLTFKEWFKLINCSAQHEKHLHLNKSSKEDYLKLTDSVQELLPKLSERDAVFYVNPIDFQKCFEDHNLLDHNTGREGYKQWFCAYPLHRVSSLGLREIVLFSSLGSIAVLFIYFVGVFEVIYLTFRTEFEVGYSPSISELFNEVKLNMFSLRHWIRAVEAIVVLSPQLLQIYDICCASVDIHIVTSRAHKIARIFENHLGFARYEKQRKFETQLSQIRSFVYINAWKIDPNFQHNQSREYYVEYNKQIRHDANLIRLLYCEFLSVRKHHTQFINFFIISGGIGSSYAIASLILQPIFAEIWILSSFLMSCVIPIVGIVLYCAKMERTVSLQ